MTTPEPRQDLRDLTPYHSSDSSGAQVRLHANENPYPPPPHVMAEIAEAVSALELNRYPDPLVADLRDAIAAYAGVDADRIVVGDGSNEVLLQTFLAFGGPGRSALLFQPTYRMHHRQARMAGTTVTDLARGADFAIDVDAAVAKILLTQPDVVVVCSPNNPTGTVTSRPEIVRLAEAADGLVVVDEAYFEFSGSTMATDQPDNVLVARTLSKALRLAGVRIGYGIAHPEVGAAIEPVRMPYAQSAPAQAAALVALKHADELLEPVEEMKGERERLAAALSALPGCSVAPSGANFVFFTIPDAAGVNAGLASQGIVIRDFTTLVDDALRVSVGTPAENDAFLDAITALTS